jgi:hypothetical protein
MSAMSDALFGRKPDEAIWQDREIRFDLGAHELLLRRGEAALKSLVSFPSAGQRAPLPPQHEPAAAAAAAAAATRCRRRSRTPRATTGSTATCC